MELPGGGLYEFHVLVDGEELGFIPLGVIADFDRRWVSR